MLAFRLGALAALAVGFLGVSDLEAAEVASASGAGCLDIDMGANRGGGGSGRNAIVWPQCHGGGNQDWRVEGGTLRATVGGRDWCLDIDMGAPTGSGGGGRNVIAWPQCHGGGNQRWTDLGDGVFQAQSQGQTWCLDVNMGDPVGSGGTGRNVIAWPQCHGGGNQRWSFAGNATALASAPAPAAQPQPSPQVAETGSPIAISVTNASQAALTIVGGMNAAQQENLGVIAVGETVTLEGLVGEVVGFWDAQQATFVGEDYPVTGVPGQSITLPYSLPASPTPTGSPVAGAAPPAENPLITLTEADRDAMVSQIVASIVQEEVIKLETPMACWRDSYGRGVGQIPDCGPNQEKDGLLCYNKCNRDPRARANAGYSLAAGICSQDCPAGFRDDGLFCRKHRQEYWIGDKGFPWQFGDALDSSGMFSRCETKYGAGGCQQLGAIVYPKCDAGYVETALFCRLEDPQCSKYGMRDGGALALGSCEAHNFIIPPVAGECSGGRENDAGLCYPKCRPGHAGVGPVCWASCPASLPVNCGASCAASHAACGMTVGDQVLSPLLAAANVGIIAGTLGTGTGASIAAKAAASTAKGAAKVAAKMGARAVAKQALKASVKLTVRKTVKSKARQIVETLMFDAAVGTAFSFGISGGFSADNFGKLVANSGEQTRADLEKGLEIQLGEELETFFLADESIDAVVEAVMKGVEEQAPGDPLPWEALDPTGVAEIVVAYALPVCSRVEADQARKRAERGQ